MSKPASAADYIVNHLSRLRTGQPRFVAQILITSQGQIVGRATTIRYRSAKAALDSAHFMGRQLAVEASQE